MSLQEQIELVDDLIAEDAETTIKDWVWLMKELEMIENSNHETTPS